MPAVWRSIRCSTRLWLLMMMPALLFCCKVRPCVRYRVTSFINWRVSGFHPTARSDRYSNSCLVAIVSILYFIVAAETLASGRLSCCFAYFVRLLLQQNLFISFSSKLGHLPDYLCVLHFDVCESLCSVARDLSIWRPCRLFRFGVWFVVYILFEFSFGLISI